MDEYEEMLFQGARTQHEREHVETTKPRKKKVKTISAQDIIDGII